MHSRDRDLSDSIVAAARVIRHHHMAALEPFGLTPSQSRALRVLARSDEPVRSGDVAERLRIAPRSATDVLDSLVASGVVTRTADPHDRRAVRIGLTDAGRSLVDDVARAQRRTTDALFDTLTAEERTTLGELLDRLVPD